MYHVVVVVLVLILAACSSNEPTAPAQPTASSPPSATASTTATVTGKVPRGAIVSLIANTGAAPPPTAPAVMDQVSRMFVPELLVARVGQPVEFRNSEDMEHNVIVANSRTGRNVFNEAPAPFQKYVHTFETTGIFAVSCDIHPTMKATVVVTPSPHTAVADASGAFTLTEVPPGTYRMMVMSDAGDQEKTVEVKVPRTDITP
jgi:plastocyanin